MEMAKLAVNFPQVINPASVDSTRILTTFKGRKTTSPGFTGMEGVGKESSFGL